MDNVLMNVNIRGKIKKISINVLGLILYFDLKLLMHNLYIFFA